MGKETLKRLQSLKKKILEEGLPPSPLKKKEEEILDVMNKAIEDTYLSAEERENISKLIEEFHDIVMADNRVDEKEAKAIEKIETTLKMIIEVHDRENPDESIL